MYTDILLQYMINSKLQLEGEESEEDKDCTLRF